MFRQARSKKLGFLLVTALLVLTLAGHLATRESSALPSTSLPELVGSDSLVTLKGRLDRSAILAGGDGEVRMELSLAAADLGGVRPRAGVDMIVVLDRSGSMGGFKIASARAAIEELITRLGPGDRMGLVAFSSGAEVLIPPQPATPVARAAWRRLVAEVTAGGGTNMSQGLDRAVELARQLRSPAARHAGPRPVGRMLLISDGEANEGDPTPEGLKGRARQASRLEFVLSSIGVGEHFNEFLMSAVADAGTGNYYYLSETSQLAEVFANEFEASRETVASAVAVTLRPAPGVEVVDAAGYPLEPSADGVTFRPGALFAGQERRLWVTLRLSRHEAGDLSLGTVQASYTHGGERRAVALPEEPRIACVKDRDVFFAGVDRDTWARSVVEEDYGRLRQEVAGLVRAGRREEALQQIGAYEKRNRMMNEALESEEVTSNLDQVRKLEAEVKDAFEGRQEQQRVKQNKLSKSHQASSWDARRGGSKKAGKGSSP